MLIALVVVKIIVCVISVHGAQGQKTSENFNVFLITEAQSNGVLFVSLFYLGCRLSNFGNRNNKADCNIYQLA